MLKSSHLFLFYQVIYQGWMLKTCQSLIGRRRLPCSVYSAEVGNPVDHWPSLLPRGKRWCWAGGEVKFQGINLRRPLWWETSFKQRPEFSVGWAVWDLWGKVSSHGIRNDWWPPLWPLSGIMNEGSLPNINSSFTDKVNLISPQCRVICIGC